MTFKMAEGGNVSGRKGNFENDSFVKCNLPCCVCLKKNIRIEADTYCTNCMDYFCKECVNMHDLWPALSDHVIVGKMDIKQKHTEGKLPSIPTNRCSKHETMIVDMYCETHNEVGCTTCFSVEHRRSSCIKMYIPGSLMKLFQSEQILQAEEYLSMAVQDLKAELVLRHKSKTELYNLKTKASKAMEGYYNEIFLTVDELKKETTASLDKLFNEIDAIIEEQKSEITPNLSIAENVLKNAKSANNEGCNKAQQFVCGIIADATTRTCEALTERLKCPSIEAITFTEHLSCKGLFEPLLQYKTLGTFHIEQTGEHKLSCQYNSKAKQSLDVLLKIDNKTCVIRGSCILHNSTLLLTDRYNHRLKRLLPKRSYVSDYLDLPGGKDTPWSVCAISHHEAAVTLPNTSQIQFVSIGNTMKMTRTMKVEYTCYGIAYHTSSRKLYVSDSGTTVYEYNATGKLLRKISKNKSGNRLFSDIHNMAVSKSGCVLYVADWNKGLIAVDIQIADEIWQYKSDYLKDASGVCVDGRGSVFVCGGNSHNVLQFRENGKMIGEVLTQTDGIYCLTSVCFNKYRDEMIVTNNTEIITILSL